MSDIKRILTENGFTFNKQFGQNFLTDTNLLDAIVRDAKVSADDVCVEVGAGAGALTCSLAAACKQVIAYEIDRRLESVLAQTVPYDNVRFVFADVMKRNYADFESEVGGRYRIVANLPYYISTPFIATVAEQSKECASLTVMVQREVADRLCARENSKDYGSLSVAVQAVSNAVITRKVSRALFTPVPNVDSAVVHMDFCRDKYQIDSRQALRQTVRSAFAMRRKTLQNNLCSSFGIDKVRAVEFLTAMGLNPSVRGETLSVEQFVKLSNLLYSASVI